ncbi:MAG TPA: HsdR family type I site-specific deoxyribonuclease, partial [Candidatus Deferrimicrobiaceae bacterium]|nr:HsdR family type I site-specific deoxyribonuclease [Candidatus Deferrimicrobiaceae bacterium]
AVNQFTVVEGQHNRRPDIVLFLNGLPIGVIELKNPADENATIWSAFNQLQTYKRQVPSLFASNEALVISDGLEARIGTITANREWFMPWRTIEGEDLASPAIPQLQVLLQGVFEKRRFLDLLRHFIVFEDQGGGLLVKKMAGYHQFHAVRGAVEATVNAASPSGDKRCGVVWHTQGSGKSLTMAFYAGRIVLHPAMENPTLVVITDRNDLDDQLFGTFSRCNELLRQSPEQAQDRAHLRELLQVASGGVVFTTIHKFFPDEKGDRHPMLSGRRNIVVIADEAHRSQYDFIDGFARHLRDALPNASFIGFTGTPIELTDKNTRAVFGDYISIYDIQRAVQDGATVPIYYEGRMAKLELDEQERPHLDEEFEEATEGEEVDRKEKLKTKWAALEAIVGTKKRIGLIAQDLVDHYALRLEAMEGKAMVVCMSRRICVDLYNAITILRPDWHDEDDAKGTIKIVMTGSASDPLEWQQHVRNKPRREGLAKRFKDPEDPMKVVLVRDMWLTGFDAPSLHTMYVDKPMRGHGLMQAIARVNRVFRDKPGGLVVDYLGLADHLRRALAVYTESGGEGSTAIDQNEAVAVMLEKYEICYALFHGFDWSFWITGKPAERISLIPAAQEHILAQEDGKPRLLKAVTELSQAFALAVPHEKALRIRDDVSFFQAVRAAIAKSMVDGRRSPEEIEQAIQQIVSKAITTEQIVDIFAAAGLKKPDLSILSDEFLAEVRGMPHRNLAVELLRKLLSGEIKTRSRKNLVQSKSFSEMLERTLRAYQNRAIETAQVIEELIALAREMRAADRRGEKLGLAEEEVAFYDALETNDSAVQVLGDETLRTIARELVETVHNNVTIDWTVKESVRAKLRIMVKRVLRKHGYPPDKEEQATRTVLEQAELLGRDWAEEAVPARDARAEAVPSDVLPFRSVSPREEDKYRTCVPLLSLKAAAGAFGDVQSVEPDGWVEIPGARKLRPGMFVAQVVGRSMAPRVSDGAWCLFRGPVEGSRQGRTVLIQHRDIQDPETGGSYTVKRYRSGKVSDGRGSWRHTEIRLVPENPEFAPIVLTEAREDEVRVVAELIEVLG